MRFAVILAVLLAISGCSDKVTNNYNINNGVVSAVKASVIAWYCSIGDLAANPDGGSKFNSEGLHRARVTFSYINGSEHSQYTDESSEVVLELPHGPYQIIVETQYSWPDTFRNYLIPRDTLMALDVRFDFLFAESIHVRFQYDPSADSLGSLEEWRLISKLASMNPNMFSTGQRHRTQTWHRVLDITISDYWIPIKRGTDLFTYEVIDAVSAALLSGKADGTFPDFMYLMDTNYFCLSGSS